MGTIHADNSLSIGNTPLVQLQRVAEGCHAWVLAKIEGRNPAFSVKCRIGVAMVNRAERDGLLVGGKELSSPLVATPVLRWLLWLRPRAFPSP